MKRCDPGQGSCCGAPSQGPWYSSASPSDPTLNSECGTEQRGCSNNVGPSSTHWNDRCRRFSCSSGILIQPLQWINSRLLEKSYIRISCSSGLGQLLSFMVTGLNDCLVLLGALSIKAINPQAPERNHLCRMKNTMIENRQRNRVSFTHSVGTRIDSWVASNALLAKLPLPASAWLLLSRPGALFRLPTRH